MTVLFAAILRCFCAFVAEDEGYLHCPSNYAQQHSHRNCEHETNNISPTMIKLLLSVMYCLAVVTRQLLYLNIIKMSTVLVILLQVTQRSNKINPLAKKQLSRFLPLSPLTVSRSRLDCRLYCSVLSGRATEKKRTHQFQLFEFHWLNL